MIVRGVSREAGIADHGFVLTGELDDSLSYDGAAMDTAPASRPALAEVFLDRESGCVPVSGDVSHTGVGVVGS